METNKTLSDLYPEEPMYHEYWMTIPLDNITDGLFWHRHWLQWPPVDHLVNLVAAVLMVIVFLLGLVGNTAVIFVYHRETLTVIPRFWRPWVGIHLDFPELSPSGILVKQNKKLQTAANMYVVNLASTDLIMCLVNFPMLIWACLEGSWPLGNFWCQVYAFAGGLSGFVSMNTLTAMALDRYHVIYRNDAIRFRSSKKIHSFIVVFIWVYSLVWSVFPLVGWGRYTLSGGRTSCCFDYLSRDPVNISFVVCLFIFCFTIQFLIITFCYGSLLVYICRYGKFINRSVLVSNSAANTSGKKLKLELRMTKLIFVIISTFCLSWVPFGAVALIGAFGNPTLVTPLASVIPGLLAKTSTVINPILYAISHPKFRCVLSPRCPNIKSRRNTFSNLYHTSVCITTQPLRGVNLEL